MKSNRAAYMLIGVLLVGYLVLHYVLPGNVPGTVLGYVIRPGFWLLVAVFAWRLPAVSPAGKLGLRRELLLLGVMAGGFHVFMLIMGGIFSGFGNSPYSHQPLPLVRNILVVAATLVGVEMARARILGSLGKKWPTVVIAFTSVLFTALILVPSQFGQLTGWKSGITFMGETVMPLLAINALASVFSYLGGPRPAIAYRAVLLAFEWLSPVLPDLTWGIAALLGVMVPALGVAAVQMLAAGRLRTARRIRGESSQTSMTGWISGAVFILALFWFSLGLLPVYPATVITGSMTPLLDPGDVVIAIKVDPSEIEVGDVIDFLTPGMRVIHRVIEVQGEGDNTTYVTKGDANPSPDSDPVLAANVRGKMIGSVPYVGRVVLFLRSEPA